MGLRVDVEFIDVPDESERMKKISGILSKGVYAYLKNEGFLKDDPNRRLKAQEAINKARDITNLELPEPDSNS